MSSSLWNSPPWDLWNSLPLGPLNSLPQDLWNSLPLGPLNSLPQDLWNSPPVCIQFLQQHPCCTRG